MRWETQQVGFIDAWLAVRAARQGVPICSANERDFPTSLDNAFLTAKLSSQEEA